MRLLGGGVKAVHHLFCGKQSLLPTMDTVSSKTQNERWVGTGRRSICDNYFV